MVYVFPTASAKITSYFGNREQPKAGASTDHKGIDIGVPTGTPIHAAQSGVIVASGASGTAGNFIRIRDEDGIETIYMHLSERIAKAGETVSAGDIIGKSGNTGNTTGAHLHFGVFKNGIAIDPLTLTYADNYNYVNQEKAASALNFKNEKLGIILPIGIISLLILAILRR